ncbi:MAG: ethylbenzene dehydrogenase-related protein [Rhodomicrobiaceae bacterium]
MARRAIKKTDFGTIILHWALVVLLLMAVGTGLRIAIGAPYDMLWLQSLDWLLPQSTVWTLHIPTGSLLFGLAVSYTIYIFKARLFRRIQPDFARLSGIAGRRRARLGALNIILYWVFFLTIVMELITGILLYLGYAGSVADLHLIGTWLILGYVPAHLATHLAIGGAPQLLRIFNPGKLAPPPPPFDPYELLATAAMRSTGNQADPSSMSANTPPVEMHAPQTRSRPMRERPPRRRSEVLRVHPLTVAIGGGLAALAFLMSLDQATRDEFVIEEVWDQARLPVIDGDVSDPIWRSARPVRVRTQQGANLDGNGGTVVEIRAVHDGVNAYFLFVWNDPTRSLKHLPLAKTSAGWRVLQDKFDHDDANAFFEDKLAVLLAPSYVLIPGDNTFHAGHTPLPGKPSSGSGRGLHYTTNGGYVDVWEWSASEGGMTGWMDDLHFGPPLEPTKAELTGAQPYKGGFAPDPGDFPYQLNFERRGPGGYEQPIQPKRLPKDLKRTVQALGTIDLNADRGEGEGSRWWMTEAETIPYSPEADKAIPVGTIIPGIIAGDRHQGDRADIRCAAKWSAGRWALEVVRRLNTHSRYDVPIQTGTYLRVSVFDHTQTRHTRHIRPILLKVEKCRKVARCLSTTKDSKPNAAISY